MDRIMDAFFKSLNCQGLLITDSKGVVIQVEDKSMDFYGVDARELIGRSVYDMEKEGLFRPSAAATVLQSGREVNLIQKVKSGIEIIVTAFPVTDEQGKIAKVVTFSRDISEYARFRDMYEDFMKKIDQYNHTMDELAYKTAIIEDFHTDNRDFQQTLETMQSVAKYDVNILLQGETGVGKTLLAKKIHNLSEKKEGRFVEINCGAMPENLIESELFGYEKGAFTGADSRGKEGLIEAAAGGTLFLDEVSEMPLSSQVKLLKVIQDREFRRIGGTGVIRADCRFISATNKDLAEAVRQGTFRQDLMYRLNTVAFNVPPLRERKEDILYLSKSLLDAANKKYGLERIFDTAVLNLFLKYSWPGNTRELENVINRMAITSQGNVITKTVLPENILTETELYSETAVRHDQEVTDLAEAMEQYEGRIIRSVYEREGSSIKVARALNISQTTAARKIRKYVQG
ncbi:sigma 54-interacting transcriptional regulator [Anaerovorax odorimutans]|uniref:HTH-type transcriptional regulatory protein TyrR n=1 Tax=Anaerovorax odorimutans TaxID=109327 RepID=A0ABT1RRA2_9FIRM|nr:sigma 54-interacting transcriptional regulator [Anaerovorax odorimutans]MCQ4637725.1 sigma 54-interacting transcriptional regulator [Anaerovorax odorimutans]